MSGNIEGATCALHEEAAATATCERCGNNVCDLCEADEHGMCPPCRERLGIGTFPFTRDDYTVGGVLSFGYDRFKQHIAPLVLGTLILFGVSFGLGVVRSIIEVMLGATADPGAGAFAGVQIVSLVFQVVEAIITAVLELGLTVMCIDALTGRTPRLGALGRAWSKLGKRIVLNLVIGAVALVAVGIPAGILVTIVVLADSTFVHVVAAVLGLLLLIPLVYVSLGWIFGTTEIAYDEDVDPIEALRRSWRIATGHRWPILGASVLGGLIVLGGLLLCGVGIVFAQPIAMMLQAGIYLALRNGSGLPAPRRADEHFGSTSTTSPSLSGRMTLD
jgi:hypothetical protein